MQVEPTTPNADEIIREFWHVYLPVLDVIDPAKAPWLGEFVLAGRNEGLSNEKIAQRVRTYGGVMSGEAKAARKLPTTARLGTAFYDALNARGRDDPQTASRAIVSRIFQIAVWHLDYLTAEANPDWKIVFHRGPRCCDLAHEFDGAVLAEFAPPPLSHAERGMKCDKLFCSCRTVPEPARLAREIDWDDRDAVAALDAKWSRQPHRASAPSAPAPPEEPRARGSALIAPAILLVLLIVAIIFATQN